MFPKSTLCLARDLPVSQETPDLEALLSCRCRSLSLLAPQLLPRIEGSPGAGIAPAEQPPLRQCPTIDGLDPLDWSIRHAFPATSLNSGRKADVRATFLNLILAASCCKSAENIRKQVSALQSELDAYRTALDQHAIVAITDRRGKITHVNEPFCRISRYRREELIGQYHNIVNSGHHPRSFFVAMWRDIAAGRVWRGEICNRAKDGTLYWVDTSIVPYRDDGGRNIGYVSIRYDITERKTAEANLLEENAQREKVETLLLDILETLPDGVAAFDADEGLILSNKAYRDIHDTVSDEIRAGMKLTDLMSLAIARGQFVLPDPSDNGQAEWLEARLKAFRRPGGALVQHFRGDRWVQVRERRSHSGNTVGVRTDITDLKKAEITIKQQAERDPLTGLYNRSVLNSHIQKACVRAQRGDYTGALVVGDLDDFKSINDTLGHDAGDALLKEVASRLCSNLRSNDIVLRLGGDEFAIILPKISSREALIRLLNRVITSVCQPVAIGSRRVLPRCSLGVSLFPDHAAAPVELMKNADIALYAAKNTNRGGCRIFDQSMRVAVEKRDRAAASLRSDVAAGRLSVALQPQVALADGSHVGFEALARWSCNGRPVPPTDFIPIAEESGLIVQLGTHVLERALAAATALERPWFRFGTVAVNIAAAQLKTDGFAAQIAAMLSRYRIAAENLELEITENTLLDRGADKIARALGELKQLGVKLALDDFGTGYASLVHLKRFSVDRLKIDRSFVCDIETSQDSSAISRAIISLAHSLGLKVVAEGVETKEQLKFLRGQRCDFGQGYLFGRPLEGEALVEYVNALKPGMPARASTQVIQA